MLADLLYMEVTVNWFVVASQKKLRIYIKTADKNQLQLLKILTNPLGSEKRRALIRKEAGRGVKSIGRVGFVNYSQLKRRDPHDEAVLQFAKEISQFLEGERLKKNFDSLTVVAEPHLLGKIRAEMKAPLKNLVIKWIKKDLQKLPQKQLTDYLLRNHVRRPAFHFEMAIRNFEFQRA